jgi:glycosyltransferase involved in cell wall biosynthesis
MLNIMNDSPRNKTGYDSPDLTFIIPLHNEENSIVPLYNKLNDELIHLGKSYEIIFIDDGSTDTTFEKLSGLIENYPGIIIIKLRSNFGKSVALDVGFQHSHGKTVITMDGDLQDDPEDLPRFLEKIREGYDLVCGWKVPRNDSFSKRIPSLIFNNLTRFVTGINLHDFNCGYKAYKSSVIKNVHLYGEMHRYIPVIAVWNGFRVSEIAINHHARRYGTTKYGPSRLVKGFLDLVTIKFLIHYNSRPLHFFGIIGLVSFFVGFVFGIYLLYTKYFLNSPIGDRPLLLLSILLIILGLQCILADLFGEMITYQGFREHFKPTYIEIILPNDSVPDLEDK